ncbi:iron-containing alcohol dehydrogenase family protein [Candidatus Altiarchaeota archaeon]
MDVKAFEYFMPTHMIFGPGCFEKTAELIKSIGCRKAFLVTGRDSMKKSGVIDRLSSNLSCDIIVYDGITSEPDCAMVDDCADRSAGCDAMILLGGGSVMDAGKVANIINTCGGSCSEYINGKKKPGKGLPLICIPTTSGTGSEVSRVSVIKDEKAGVKRSLKDPNLHAQYAILDPQITSSMPPGVTAASGMDALTHAIESFSSIRSNHITRIFSAEAIRKIRGNLRRAFDDGTDMDARCDMMLGSLYAGLGFSNAGNALVHGLASPIGGMTGKPHGLVCGMLLPIALRFNKERAGDVYDDLARSCGFREKEDIIEYVEWLVKHFGFPERLSDLGITGDDLDWIIGNISGSAGNNPGKPALADVKTMLEEMI